MAKYVKYMGEFLSRQGVRWRAEILVEAEAEFPEAEIGNLVFEGDEPIVIEWGNTPKSQAVCSSSATLRIESPGDRTYTDLYSIAPGEIRLDIRRDGQLYWSGTLDPEFYEEPYERAANYPVSLTFSDLGILDRLNYDLTGLQSLYAILSNALERAGLNYEGIDYKSYCSTYFSDINDDKPYPATIADLALRSDNFIDEDGSPKSLREVIEGMLLPLGLRLIQRAGKIYVYDLNGLWAAATTKEIYWTSDSQTLSVDSVYNNVVITFSPYAEETTISSEITYTGDYSPEKVNAHYFLDYEERGINYFSFATNYSQEDRPGGINGDWDNIHFTIFLSETEGTGLAYLNSKARYAHILPVVNGPEETDCIAWKVVAGHHSLKKGPQFCYNLLNDVSPNPVHPEILMKTHRAYLPYLYESQRKPYYLRLTLPMLLDMRYNPFSGDTDDNDSDNQNQLKTYGTWIFIPVKVNLYNDKGELTHHYINHHRTYLGTQGNFTHAIRGGKWIAADSEDKQHYCWLEYYDPSGEIKGTTAAGQWVENRQNIGRPDVGGRITIDDRFFSKDNMKFRIYESFKAMPAGEFIPYPPAGGYIEIVVYTGVRGFRWGENQSADNNFSEGWDATKPDIQPNLWVRDKIYDKIRWMLYKAPNLEIVKNNLIFDAAELDDIEYSGELNKDAKEELSMNTICGTIAEVSPTARGTYFHFSDGRQVRELTRAEVTDQAENLLIGTLYSQYAGRMTILSGENEIDPDGLNLYSEPNQPRETKFLMMAETQDVITDTAETTFVEVRPDNYERRK